MRCKYLLLLFLVSCFNVSAQLLPLEQNIQNKNTPHLNLIFNRVVNGNLHLFYNKLAQLKRSGAGVVTIVHIGDSHIQPDFLSSVIRSRLQHFFGNAGRGLVFPYQVAKSNAPTDVSSSSNISWNYNRLAHPEIPIECGIAGHAIQSGRPLAKINFSLRDNLNGPQFFNRIKFFVDDDSASSWQFETATAMMPVMLSNKVTDSTVYKAIILEKPVSGFSLTSHSAGDLQSFYGAILQNDEAGILLHTIGVNGARYDHYNNQPLFWQQLPALEADLVIVSLGTNEAQGNSFNADAFLLQVKLFIEKVKTAFPGAALLISTPQDSYKGKRSNEIMRSLNFTLSGYCQQNNIALWDLYKVTNGYGSARNWLRKGWMNKDRVHFTSDAYTLQGKLLFNALAQGYNDYIRANQNFK